MNASHLILTLAAVLPFAACTEKTEKSEPKPESAAADSSSSAKIAVVYFSWSPDGNTRFAAETIAKKVGADLFEITPEKPYSTDFKTCCDEAKDECKGKLERPIKQIEGLDLKKYDLVFIGTPNWWGTLAPPARTFAQKNLDDLKGKKVCLFLTHGSGGMQNLGKDFAELIGDKATVLPPKAFTGATIRENVKALEEFATERTNTK